MQFAVSNDLDLAILPAHWAYLAVLAYVTMLSAAKYDPNMESLFQESPIFPAFRRMLTAAMSLSESLITAFEGQTVDTALKNLVDHVLADRESVDNTAIGIASSGIDDLWPFFDLNPMGIPWIDG